MTQSFSNPGTPLDNAVAESFFACMKREELSHNLYETREQLETDVAEYVDYFNNRRPHQRLGFRTPIQVEDEFFLNKKSSDKKEKAVRYCLNDVCLIALHYHKKIVFFSFWDDLSLHFEENNAIVKA